MQSVRLKGGPEARRKPLFGRTGSVCDNSQGAVIQPAHPEHVEGYERLEGQRLTFLTLKWFDRLTMSGKVCRPATDGEGRWYPKPLILS